MSPEQQVKRIEVMKKEGNSTIFVAKENDVLIGYLIYLVVGILSEFRGLGVGTKLFKHLEDWAREHSVHRLELSVATRNEAGLRLYKKMGFDIEGTKRHSLFFDGEFVDEYYMSKLI
ncbi:MAG: GCN5-like N-acetyltransferase [Neobacillus sp.]|nr:GCN5-like N-acetyltransferase [Neobacillus sp.]